MQPNQQVTFLTDGGDDIRDLPRYLNPQAEHLLDWFHITMRTTVLTQLTKGLRVPPERSANIAQDLQRVKWFLWHGNVFRALQTVDDLTDLTDTDTGVESGKLAKAVREFGGYLAANASCIRWLSELAGRPEWCTGCEAIGCHTQGGLGPGMRAGYSVT